MEISAYEMTTTISLWNKNMLANIWTFNVFKHQPSATNSSTSFTFDFYYWLLEIM